MQVERGIIRQDLPPVKVVQICHVVANLEAACADLHSLLGIGPFIGGGEVELSDHIYRGSAAAPITLKGVFVQSGEMNIELVELTSKAPSAFHDMFPAGETGIHHTAMFCEDYQAEKAAFEMTGCPVVSEFSFGDLNFCYVDTRAQLGHMLELYPEMPIIRDMYRQAKDAPARWDGRDIILPWGTF